MAFFSLTRYMSSIDKHKTYILQIHIVLNVVWIKSCNCKQWTIKSLRLICQKTREEMTAYSEETVMQRISKQWDIPYIIIKKLSIGKSMPICIKDSIN